MQKLIEKAGVLIEALPYIQKFRGKEVLIKYGGAALTYQEVRDMVLQDLVFMSYMGIRPILIHGGGKFITENMKKKGIQSQFVNGLRVTDKPVISVVNETLAELNRSIVRDIERLGGSAVGLSGFDAEILNVVRHTESGDVGYVGDVSSVNTVPIKELTEFGRIPVIFPVGKGPDGEMYNVNADEAAANIASAMQVQKFMVLTNVRGILRDAADDETLIPSLQVGDTQKLIDQGVISGGMIPKVKACIDALQGGVQKAHIIDGRITHALLLEIFTDQGIGTEITL
ncbi:MAG: Acetylglutamate kinase [Candidatus Omnitrophica bacterium ADurb.Bin277]|nr:MAG: Acetylglutamate kinase [Candidatus Omnitrophica bacterium ADurb.Bin277]